MSDVISYEERLKQFDWAIAEQELGWRRGEPINIGWYCSDRICRLGSAAKPALIWEDAQGDGRTYTYDDLRVLSNTIAAYLQRLGLQPGERVCLFMDRVPELYIGFLGILKMGGDRPAAVLGLRRRVAAHAARQRADRGHPDPAQARGQGAQDPRRAARRCATSSWWTPATGRRCRRARSPLALDQEPRVESFEVYPSDGRDAVGAALHLGHHRPAQGRPARALLADLAVPDHQVGARPQAGRRLLVQRRPRLGHRHLLRHHRPLGQRRHAGRARLGLHRRALVRLHRRSTGSPSGTPRPPPSAC